MSWRHNSNGNPTFTTTPDTFPGTPDIARRWLITGNQDGITEIQMATGKSEVEIIFQR